MKLFKPIVREFHTVQIQKNITVQQCLLVILTAVVKTELRCNENAFIDFHVG